MVRSHQVLSKIKVVRRHQLRRLIGLLITIALMGSLLPISQKVLAQQWRPVRGGIMFGISGMALIQQQSDSLNLLVAHDNKQQEESRLAILRIQDKNQPEYFPLKWPVDTDLPLDLEAVTSVPGKNNPSFMTSSSSGKIYQLKLDKLNNILILKRFDFPNIPEKSNFEGFALQEIEGKLLAVWAHRGQGKAAARLYWGTLDLDTYQIKLEDSTSIKVPWPTGADVRHISDLKVDKAGILYITSATDPGNDGPFQSAVYTAGVFGVNGNTFVFRQNPELFPLYRYPYHKIEAIELVPGTAGGIIVGTDDENMGSSVYFPDNS